MVVVRRIIAAVLFVAACAAGPGSRGPVLASSAALPACTVIAVQTIDTVDSKTAHAGDFFRFRTVNAVTDHNRIVIGPHTMGWGIVSVAVPAAKGGRAGSLVLEPLYFVMSGGRHMGVVLDHNSSELQIAGASYNVPGYLGAIPVAGVGAMIGAFDYFHHGKDITLAKGTMFAVFPSNQPSVAACQKRVK
jgi:hypothetical protein